MASAMCCGVPSGPAASASPTRPSAAPAVLVVVDKHHGIHVGEVEVEDAVIAPREALPNQEALARAPPLTEPPQAHDLDEAGRRRSSGRCIAGARTHCIVVTCDRMDAPLRLTQTQRLPYHAFLTGLGRACHNSPP